MYVYKEVRQGLFTDEGQRMFLKVRDSVASSLATAGAVRMGTAISNAGGDSWLLMACVDRMVELGEIREINQKDVKGQDRVFVSVRA